MCPGFSLAVGTTHAPRGTGPQALQFQEAPAHIRCPRAATRFPTQRAVCTAAAHMTSKGPGHLPTCMSQDGLGGGGWAGRAQPPPAGPIMLCTSGPRATAPCPHLGLVCPLGLLVKFCGWHCRELSESLPPAIAREAQCPSTRGCNASSSATLSLCLLSGPLSLARCHTP